MVWPIATLASKKTHDAIQRRKTLALCLSAPLTAGRESLEVIAGVITTDLRLTINSKDLLKTTPHLKV